MKKQMMLVFFLLPFIIGCKKDPVTSPPTGGDDSTVVNHAVYVLNEGNYGDPAGARLTLYNYDSHTLKKDIFEYANNGQHLGNVGDDMKIVGNRMYILMSASNNIDIISLPDHKLIKTSIFPSPRSPHDLTIDPVRHHLFFTNLYGGTVTVTNDSTLSIIADIPVGNNPQGLAIAGNKLFVCNSGYGSDSTVTVINLSTLTVDTTLVVSRGPTCAAISGSGELLVSCSGDTSVKGRVYIINTANNSIVGKIIFPTNLFYNSGTMTADNSGNAYVIGVDPVSYLGGPVHKIIVATDSLILNYRPGVFYGIAFNSYTNELFLADAQNFASPGNVLIVKEDGTLNGAFSAQIGPSTFAFRWQ